jgi:hypothetical protein
MRPRLIAADNGHHWGPIRNKDFPVCLRELRELAQPLPSPVALAPDYQQNHTDF